MNKYELPAFLQIFRGLIGKRTIDYFELKTRINLDLISSFLDGLEVNSRRIHSGNYVATEMYVLMILECVVSTRMQIPERKSTISEIWQLMKRRKWSATQLPWTPFGQRKVCGNVRQLFSFKNRIKYEIQFNNIWSNIWQRFLTYSFAAYGRWIRFHLHI